jgi:hypothetical protein
MSHPCYHEGDGTFLYLRFISLYDIWARGHSCNPFKGLGHQATETMNKNEYIEFRKGENLPWSKLLSICSLCLSHVPVNHQWPRVVTIGIRFGFISSAHVHSGAAETGSSGVGGGARRLWFGGDWSWDLGGNEWLRLTRVKSHSSSPVDWISTQILHSISAGVGCSASLSVKFREPMGSECGRRRWETEIDLGCAAGLRVKSIGRRWCQAAEKLFWRANWRGRGLSCLVGTRQVSKRVWCCGRRSTIFFLDVSTSVASGTSVSCCGFRRSESEKRIRSGVLDLPRS